MRGNIETPWAGRAKEYAWSLCVRLAPRNISPMDIDYVAECGERFAFFEMKTEGAKLKGGQEQCLIALLKRLGDRAVLFIVEHPPLDRVVIPTEVTRFRCARTDEGGNIRTTKYIDGSHFAAVYGAFFQWADGGSFTTFREAIELAGKVVTKPAALSDHAEWLAAYEAAPEPFPGEKAA